MKNGYFEKILVYDVYTEKREGKNLVIFPDKPFWFIGDASIDFILDYFYRRINYNQLYDNLINKFNYNNDEVSSTLDFILNLFNEARLFNLEETERTSPRFYADYFPNPVINVTRKCNLHCKHCYADAGNQWDDSQLTFSEIKELINIILQCYNLADIDKRVLLTGGEPFLREDITDIVMYINQMGGTPLVNTNAILIRDEDMDILRKCKAELLVSLDGATKNTHDFLRGEGAFDKTLNKIKKLKNKGVITKLSMTVHSGNYDEVEPFVALAEELQVDDIALNLLNVLSRAKECEIKRIKLCDFNKKLREISKKSSTWFNYISKTDYANLGAILLMNLKFEYCGVGAASLVIDYNGDIFPCYNNMNKECKLGNIRSDDLMEIWKNSSILNKLRELNINNFSNKCKKCPIKYYCGGGCRGEAYFENKSYYSVCPYCDDMRTGIIDLMFELGEQDNELFYNRIHYYESVKSFYLHR